MLLKGLFGYLKQFLQKLSSPIVSTIAPETAATVLLTTHCQISETCKKPGTAFTTEYKAHGADVSMHTRSHQL
eukprot:6462687-Amphidinium_carterae.1